MAAKIVSDFMMSPLVTWVRTFESDGGGGLSCAALGDGAFLFDVMNHIDPRDGVGRPVNRHPDTVTARISNLGEVVQHVRTFYQDVLGQTLVSRLPDVALLAKEGETETALSELQLLLLLVLGCAVQGDHKEDVIESIKKLDLETQHAIVECIKEVTEKPEIVWPGEWSQLEGVPEDQLAYAYSLLFLHCRNLVQERDVYYQAMLRALVGDDTEEGSLQGSQDNVHHIGVELADCKAKLRRLRQEFDEKVECLAEHKEEVEANKGLITKLRQENLELVQDARAAKAYRDELDILRERATRVDKLEAEVSKYRDKMADIDFYKTRVEELREDNRILVETKEMLEEQLSNSRRRAEQILDLENTILTLKQQINELNIERDIDRERLQEVMEENAQLQLSNKNSLSESAMLVAELDVLKTKKIVNGSSMSNDLIGDAQARVLQLELDNQRMRGELEQFKREGVYASSEKVLELEKENKRLSFKVNRQHVGTQVSHLQEHVQKDKTRLLEVQGDVESKQQEAKRLHNTLEAVKTNSERQVNELQQENTQLHELIESLRERQKKTTDARLVDVENENKKIMDTNHHLQSQVSRLEYEKQHLTRLTERLRESAEKLSEVEHQKTETERENKDLHKAIAAFRETCEKHEKLEEDHANLQVDFARVSKNLENLKETLKKMEHVQSDNLSLQVEREKLSRMIESMKISSGRMADLEAEKDQLNEQNSLLQRNIQALKVERSKVEQYELDLMSASNENQKLQKNLESLQRKLAETEKERTELESENVKLQRTIETLKVSTKKLNELERDITEIEASNDRLERENKSLKKEVVRLRSAIEVKDSLIDDSSSRVSTLERDNKRLNKEVESLKSIESRVRELEKEKREIEQQSQVERKTLNTLREDLVSEKVHTQQLTNQLESLKGDLAKVGLDHNKLSVPNNQVNEDGESRFKVLESMLEETMKRSIELREEKISALESRLEESVNRNKEFRNELLQVKREYESLKQRHMEGGPAVAQDAIKEIARLQDALTRTSEEKDSVESEISVLKSQTASYREQVCALQSQVTSLSNQNTVISQHNAKLQGENARLQVENTTLQSQSASLIAQNSSHQTTATQSEAERDKLKKALDVATSKLSSLVKDHEALRKLHEQLSQEYDTLVQEHSNLKTTNKTLRAEFKAFKERQNNLSQGEDELLKLREALEAEMANLKEDSTSLANLRAEHSRLKDDFRCLFSANEKLRGEYKSMQGDYKTLKTENNSLKLKLTELSGEVNDARDQMGALDVEVAKLTNKCQVLQTINSSLEDDRRNLMSQVSLLLTQYHDLLTQTLEDKQHFHEEEKSFTPLLGEEEKKITDKLNNLRRQKEKLEEKIMEQYRRMDNSPNKKKGFGANFVRRVRKAGSELISKVPRNGRSRSRGREEGGESPDSSSLGSSSHANDSLDSGSDTRRSSPHLPASPSLLLLPSSPQDPQLASDSLNTDSQLRSHYRKSLPPSVTDIFSSQQYLSRGSISSEDVVSLRLSEVSDQQQDDDSMSTLTMTNSNNASNNNINNCKNSSSVADVSELSRVGSRRAMYYTEDDDSIPTRDVGPEPLNQNRGHMSVRSNSSSGSQQALPPRSLGSGQSSCSGSLCPSTPTSRTPTPNTAPTRSSTPKIAPWKERAVDEDIPNGTSSPQIPPRLETCKVSAPQVPPRSRRGSSSLIQQHQQLLQHQISQDTLSNSSQLSSTPGTPEIRPKLPPKPATTNQTPSSNSRNSVIHPSTQDIAALKTNGGNNATTNNTTKDQVDNSIWYEYGCV
ncbi:protein girdin isoform X5 [Oratosquilla oratoria]|uniref:protein girdin isoform X5 n=1 Tax=Oratosquilla oratoria TaxID=337810 RepID=UPI003F7599FC